MLSLKTNKSVYLSLLFAFSFFFLVFNVYAQTTIIEETFLKNHTFDNLGYRPITRGWLYSQYSLNDVVSLNNDWFQCMKYDVDYYGNLSFNNTLLWINNIDEGAKVLSSGICYKFTDPVTFDNKTRIKYTCNHDNTSNYGWFLIFGNSTTTNFYNDVFAIHLSQDNMAWSDYIKDDNYINHCGHNTSLTILCDGTEKSFTLADLETADLCSFDYARLTDIETIILTQYFDYDNDNADLMSFDNLTITTTFNNTSPYFTSLNISATEISPKSTIDVSYSGYDPDLDQVYYAYTCSDSEITGYVEEFTEDFEGLYSNSIFNLPAYANTSWQQTFYLNEYSGYVLNFSNTEIVGISPYMQNDPPLLNTYGYISVDLNQIRSSFENTPQGLIISLEDILNPFIVLAYRQENNSYYSLYNVNSSDGLFNYLDTIQSNALYLNTIEIYYNLVNKTYYVSVYNYLGNQLYTSEELEFYSDSVRFDYLKFTPFADLNTTTNYTAGFPAVYNTPYTFALDNIEIHHFNGSAYNLGVLSGSEYLFNHTCTYEEEGIYRLTSYIADYYNKDYSVYNQTLIYVSYGTEFIDDNLLGDYTNPKGLTGISLIFDRFLYLIRFPYRLLLYFGILETGMAAIYFIIIFFGVHLIMKGLDFPAVLLILALITILFKMMLLVGNLFFGTMLGFAILFFLNRHFVENESV